MAANGTCPPPTVYVWGGCDRRLCGPLHVPLTLRLHQHDKLLAGTRLKASRGAERLPDTRHITNTLHYVFNTIYIITHISHQATGYPIPSTSIHIITGTQHPASVFNTVHIITDISHQTTVFVDR
ncbi:hypothetical protein Bbelb_098180 [Branchiostoma belcheri]|nr:hypothetical protein Bbelb_098180 [Branchiostoma belcheri]